MAYNEAGRTLANEHGATDFLCGIMWFENYIGG